MNEIEQAIANALNNLEFNPDFDMYETADRDEYRLSKTACEAYARTAIEAIAREAETRVGALKESHVSCPASCAIRSLWHEDRLEVIDAVLGTHFVGDMVELAVADLKENR